MEGGKVPALKERQFYKDDYGTMMQEYEHHLQYNKKIPDRKSAVTKKKRINKWTDEDQVFEDNLWAS
jgi:hypothetical protein